VELVKPGQQMSDDSSITKGGNELEVRKRDGWSCFRRRQVRPGAFCEGLVEENGFPCCTCQQQFFVMLFYTWFFQTLTCTLPRLLFSNLAVACWLKKKTRGLYFSHMAGHGAVVAILGWENFSL
jgi:hypothetical protein